MSSFLFMNWWFYYIFLWCWWFDFRPHSFPYVIYRVISCWNTAHNLRCYYLIKIFILFISNETLFLYFFLLIKKCIQRHVFYPGAEQKKRLHHICWVSRKLWRFVDIQYFSTYRWICKWSQETLTSKQKINEKNKMRT